MKPELLTLKTDRLVLEEVSMADLDNVHQLHLIPEVDEFNTLGIPKTIADTEEFLAPLVLAQNKVPRGTYVWKITLQQTGEFIGLAGLTLSNDKFRLGEIYYKLHPGHWGKGYATEVAKGLVRLGFDKFELHKVEAGVATGNARSVRVLEKAGMTREGIRRKILPIRGSWKDNYHYAIVEDDPRDY
jgi:RimJ/RimL family protein N-acetyltransferase